MSRILIVEVEKDIAEGLTALLHREGFQTAAAGSRREALELLEHQTFDLSLLDVMLPDGSGYSICTAIRGQMPVIFLTAIGDEPSVVTGFDLGADDYITKPFRPMELISRVKNALRRSGKGQAAAQLGDIRVDMVKGIVSRAGKEIVLSALEYRLLLTFLNHRGEVLSRSRLLSEIWDVGGDFVNDNTLTVNIKRLRDKLEDDPVNPALIRTVRGRGYIAE